MPKPIPFEQTPWENWDAEQLRRQLNATYSALVEARSILRLSEAGYETSPFWKPNGSGHRALFMANQVVEGIEAKYSSEQIYRRFFRMANSLLFPEVHHKWMICDQCGNAFSNATIEQELLGNGCIEQPFGKPGCAGTFRLLRWSDLDRKL